MQMYELSTKNEQGFKEMNTGMQIKQASTFQDWPIIMHAE